jgi:hypothetical protein
MRGPPYCQAQKLTTSASSAGVNDSSSASHSRRPRSAGRVARTSAKVSAASRRGSPRLAVNGAVSCSSWSPCCLAEADRLVAQ